MILTVVLPSEHLTRANLLRGFNGLRFIISQKYPPRAILTSYIQNMPAILSPEGILKIDRQMGHPLFGIDHTCHQHQGQSTQRPHLPLQQKTLQNPDPSPDLLY